MTRKKKKKGAWLILSTIFSGETEEKHRQPKSLLLVARLRFESEHVRNAGQTLTTWTRSVSEGPVIRAVDLLHLWALRFRALNTHVM